MRKTPPLMVIMPSFHMLTKFSPHARIQRGGGGATGGPDPPPGKSQKFRGFSNTGPDPLEIFTKLPIKPALKLGLSFAR